MYGQPIAALPVSAGGPDGLPRAERLRADLIARAGGERRASLAEPADAPTRVGRP